MIEHYACGGEDARLFESAEGRLEYARTRELLERYLPPAPVRLLDVGGATGHYAVWLTELGYTVHLVDPVPLHVEQAMPGQPRRGSRWPVFASVMYAVWMRPTRASMPSSCSGRSIT